MELIEFTADDPGLTEAYKLQQRVSAHDTPWRRPISERRYELQMRHGWTGEPARYFRALVDGRLVGLAELFTSKWDNPGMAWIEVHIDPEQRRRGHGTALLEALIAEAGRTGQHLITACAFDTPGARAFTEALGWPLGSTEAIRRLLPQRFPRTHWDELYAEAASHAGDYELIRILGATPESLLDGVAAVTEAINDAPIDDLEWERENHPAERVREYEQANLASDHRFYRIVARHRTSGELAAHTVVVVDADNPQLGDQHDTTVHRGHRGHRLGLLVKAAMMQWLAEAEPQIELIDTGNAASNEHMIAINERLGYEVIGQEIYFQRRF